MSDTATLERIDTDTDLSNISPDDAENAAHYFRKTDMDKLMFGDATEIMAVCGFKAKQIYKPVNGRTRCGKCVEIYDAMRD